MRLQMHNAVENFEKDMHTFYKIEIIAHAIIA